MSATVEDVAVTEPGVYTMPAEAYHADPALSSSGARKLLPPSCPAIFWYERENPPASTRTFDHGHAAHTLVLGEGDPIAPIDAPDWRTNAAKQAREEARAAGMIPLLTGDYRIVLEMADALRRHPIASVLFQPGRGTPEASLFHRDSETGVMLRGRLDWLPDATDGRMILADYKTAACASLRAFAGSAAKYGYHVQHAWYVDMVTALGLADDPALVFVTQEKAPPYLITVVELDSEAVNIGRQVARQAIDLFARCVAADDWPSYTEDVALVGLPRWYVQGVDVP